MTAPLENWRPTPELLAAYFDGECEGRDDLFSLKNRIENWLNANPEAREELAEQRRLLHIWQETTPPEPPAEQWSAIMARLEKIVASRLKSEPAARPPSFRRAGWVGAAAVMAGLAVYLAWNAPFRESIQPVPPLQLFAGLTPALLGPAESDDEIFPVAHASEVTIVRVEGADTHTLVVGKLPLEGTLELVAPGDITLTLIRPHVNKDELNPVRLIENSAPMIWAKLESETDD